ncbi:hypothetical protein [Sunxiuqinia sp. sy24]|uniref:hypothetical protein n=1 Tax=Sunxiuqinia sp. sy24 TaxID=3461495 RepID=UPI00404657E0
MNILLKRFLYRTIILTLVLFLMGWALYSQVIPQYNMPGWPFILLFFFLTTNLVHFYLLRIAEKDIAKFSTHFMVLSTLKMLFYLFVALGFFLASRDQAKLFLINYLVAYVAYTAMEVAEISHVVKLKK